MGLTKDMLRRLVRSRSVREDSGAVWKRDDGDGGEYAGEGEGGAVSAVSSYVRVVAVAGVAACSLYECTVLLVLSVFNPRMCVSARLRERNWRSLLPTECFGIGR